LVEQRYRAVLEVLDGSPVGEVAVRYGVSRQTVHPWKGKYMAAGIEELREASRRPRTSPTRVESAVEALVCEMRRTHPRWGARRITLNSDSRAWRRRRRGPRCTGSWCATGWCARSRNSTAASTVAGPGPGSRAGIVFRATAQDAGPPGDCVGAGTVAVCLLVQVHGAGLPLMMAGTAADWQWEGPSQRTSLHDSQTHCRKGLTGHDRAGTPAERRRSIG